MGQQTTPQMIPKIAIFRAGCHRDSRGVERCYSVADLDRMAAGVTDPIPHVITHKELYSPFSYARSPLVWREGDLLYADAVEPQAEFAAMVADKRLFSRSIRVAHTPEGPRIQHIAWLGAEPPAVEGLPPVDYAAGGEVVDFAAPEEQAMQAVTLSTMMRRMREFLIAKFGVEEADKVMPEYDLRDLDRYSQTLLEETRNPDAPASYSAPADEAATEDAAPAEGSETPVEEPPPEPAELAELRRANAELNARLTAIEQERQRAEFSRWVGDQVRDRRLLPGDAEGMVEELMALAQVADYAGPDGAAVSPVRRYQARIAARPPQLAGPIAQGSDPGAGEPESDYARDDRIAAQARDLQNKRAAAGRPISAGMAVDLVMSGITD
jgi:hypothetical protein